MDVTSGAGTAYPSAAHMCSLPVFSGVRGTRSLASCVGFVDRSPFSFGLFVVCPSSVLFTDSDYPFGIFKLFSTRL